MVTLVTLKTLIDSINAVYRIHDRCKYKKPTYLGQVITN